MSNYDPFPPPSPKGPKGSFFNNGKAPKVKRDTATLNRLFSIWNTTKPEQRQGMQNGDAAVLNSRFNVWDTNNPSNPSNPSFTPRGGVGASYGPGSSNNGSFVPRGGVGAPYGPGRGNGSLDPNALGNGPGSNPGGPSGSGSGGMGTVSQTTGLDLNKLYADLQAKIRAGGDQTAAEYDSALARSKMGYDNSTADLYKQYQNSRSNLDASAAGLNVNGNDIYKGLDSSLRRIQENSDNSAANDAAFYEKLKALKGGSINDLIAQTDLAKLQAQQDQQTQLLGLATGGRSGGGRSGGGKGGGKGRGSSSGTGVGKITTDITNLLENSLGSTATDTAIVNDPYIAAQIKALRDSGDNEAADQLAATHNRTSENPDVTNLQGQIDINNAAMTANESAQKRKRDVPKVKTGLNALRTSDYSTGELAYLKDVIKNRQKNASLYKAMAGAKAAGGGDGNARRSQRVVTVGDNSTSNKAKNVTKYKSTTKDTP